MKRILLLHGWDWRNYPNFNNTDPWSNRNSLVTALKQVFSVDYPSLPGFGNSAIPDAPWTLDDYAEWLNKYVSTHDYAAILGYSFGAAVLTHWAFRYDSADRHPSFPTLLLVSPAIVRRYAVAAPRNRAIISVLKRLSPSVMRFLRHVYLCYWVRNPYYLHGRSFQRLTYLNIVTIDLSKELRALLAANASVHLIFGEYDTATPPSLLLNIVPTARDFTSIIPGGDHDIASTHTLALRDLIVGILSKRYEN